MKKFIRDFDLDLNDCLFPNMNVKEKFEKFATENEEFLQKYEQYLHQSKSVEDIAENLKKPLQEVKDVVKKSLPNLFENGRFKSSVSTFGVDNRLGGNYKFIYDYFGHKSNLIQRDFIGMRKNFLGE